MTQVTRRLLQVLVLAALAAGFGLWLRQDFVHRMGKLAAADAGAQLIRCHGGDAGPTGFVLTSRRGTVALARSSGAPWSLVAPMHAAADQETVAAFLAATCALRRVGSVRAKPGEPALDLALFNLASPPHHLTLTGADGVAQTLAVGDASQFDGSLFVRVGDALDVDRIAGDYAHQLERDLFAWRDKRALAVAPEAIAEVHVRAAGRADQNFDLVRDGNAMAGFTVHGPLLEAQGLAADAAAAQGLLQAISQTSAQSFVAEHADAQALRRFGLAPPRLTISITTGEPRTHVLRLGTVTLAGDAHHFLQVGDDQAPVMQLPGDWLLQKLTGGAQSLADMRVLHVDADAVRTVVLHEGADSLALVQDVAAGVAQGAWHLAGIDDSHLGAALDSEGMRTRLHHLVHMRAADILTRHAGQDDLAHAHLTAPTRYIELLAEGRRPLAVVWVGRSDGSRVVVTDDKKQVLSRVFVSTLDDLPLDANRYLPVAQPRPQSF